MSIVRVFSLLGDSNIRQHVTKTTCRANPAISSAQVISCGHVEIFVDSLLKIRQESTVCIVACVTNFIASCEGPTSVTQRVQPVLQDIRDALLESCLGHPDREYLIAPPMYRTSPVWYREGLPEVLTSFSLALGQDLPANLRVLPSFATPEFDSGGIHLTAYSGQEYLLHLFDTAQDMLDRSPELGEVTARNSESTRVLEDRVMVLEQDHRRLNRVVDDKIAVDAELSDFRENERMEDSFVISGLTLIPDELVGKEWQKRAIADVQTVLKQLMGRELPILFVSNATKRYKDAEVTYNVKMVEMSDSKAIRRKFGSFFLGGKSTKPDFLKHISINNKVTPETNTRISVLKLLAKRYRDQNPGSRVQVVGYDPRPMIKITPASSASDRRIKNFNYVQAVRKLPFTFSATEIEPILRRINPELSGKIRSLFIILSDDAFRKILRARKAASDAASSASGQAEVAPASSEFESTSRSESRSTSRSVSETTSRSVIESASGPVHEPAVAVTRSGSRSSSGSGSNPFNRKRGPPSPADGSAAKK